VNPSGTSTGVLLFLKNPDKIVIVGDNSSFAASWPRPDRSQYIMRDGQSSGENLLKYPNHKKSTWYDTLFWVLNGFARRCLGKTEFACYSLFPFCAVFGNPDSAAALQNLSSGNIVVRRQ
jgi:hypothetical protein